MCQIIEDYAPNGNVLRAYDDVNVDYRGDRLKMSLNLHESIYENATSRAGARRVSPLATKSIFHWVNHYAAGGITLIAVKS